MKMLSNVQTLLEVALPTNSVLTNQLATFILLVVVTLLSAPVWALGL